MYFLVMAQDKPGALERRLEHRQRHIDYWVGQGDTLKVAGAMLDSDSADAKPIGSSFLLEAENESAIRTLIAGDPFSTEGIFSEEIRIQPVRPAIGEWLPG
ncbi:YciI family protein (plasmid) [Sphingobium sp. SJ10-10]|uniref:YciI family protein n=1 Tax=Sphingobium sp. SJ10-10 TaxID=3114999 RepID=UPI002E19DE75|nr:YciI family protein [Sphingobium sp. SJ10-10]